MIPRPPRSTRTAPLIPYTPLFRSLPFVPVLVRAKAQGGQGADGRSAYTAGTTDHDRDGEGAAGGGGSGGGGGSAGSASSTRDDQAGGQDRKSKRLNSSQ